MNIIIFAVLLALVLILFIAAEYLDVILHVASFGILFLLGITVMFGGLEYKTGDNIDVTYTFLPDNVTVNQTIESRAAVYTQFNDWYSHIIGLVMSVLSVGGFVLVYVHYGNKRSEEGDEPYAWR